MPLICNVIDVGARYGLHPSWNSLKSVVNFHLFEMEAEEAMRLKDKYAGFSNIKIHPVALYSSNCNLTYKVRKHKGLTSLFDSNSSYLTKNNYFVEESKMELGVTTQARTIDSIFEKDDIHFIKIDAEGADLEILIGAEGKLNTTILGARTEAYFVEFNEQVPLFGDIHQFMRKHHFDLINLDYTGQGHHLSKFTRPDRYGQLMSTDAVWIKNMDMVLEDKGEKRLHDVVFLSLFLMHNNATDIALNLLLRSINEYRITFSGIFDDPIFRRLKRDIAFLFKDLLLLPHMEEKEIFTIYYQLFGEEYPKWNAFYETYPI